MQNGTNPYLQIERSHCKIAKIAVNYRKIHDRENFHQNWINIENLSVTENNFQQQFAFFSKDVKKEINDDAHFLVEWTTEIIIIQTKSKFCTWHNDKIWVKSALACLRQNYHLLKNKLF